MDEIRELYGKYGEALFRMALYHMIYKGKDSFTEENIAEAKRQIRESDAEAKAKGSRLIMSMDFQDAIVDCAAKISKQSTTDILQFVKNQLLFDGD